MRRFKSGEITANVNKYLSAGSTDKSTAPIESLESAGDLPSRDLSWHLCYSWFREHPQPLEHREAACYQLAFYLASWGMFRGSSNLLQWNARDFIPVIEVINEHNTAMRNMGLLELEEKWEPLNHAYWDLVKVFKRSNKAHQTLVTKVLLGVWGIFPAIDTWAHKGWKLIANESGIQHGHGGYSSFTKHSARSINSLYELNQPEIDRLASQHPVFGFDGKPNSHAMPPARIVDMFLYTYGNG